MFPDNKFEMNIWRAYITNIDPAMLGKIESDAQRYDIHKQIVPIINQALINTSKMELSHNSFISATNGLSEKVADQLGQEIDVEIMLYLGLCNGAGWATTLGGKNVILLGIEKIIELDWCDEKSISTLIYHELGHIWHNSTRNPYYSTNVCGEKSLWQLYQEGIAMYCEQLLSDDFNYSQRDKNGWLDWCLENEVSIKKDYWGRIRNSESTQDFFGDWCEYLNYSDVGYFLGCQFVKFMLEKYTLKKIAIMNTTELSIEFNNYVA
jgi:hypothetical protein